MKILIGCDHGGYELKDKVIKLLINLGHSVEDCGCYSIESVDYPDIAQVLCTKLLNGEAERGILLCGTGIGMSIAANKFSGIRCAHCTDTYSAAMAREHNNSNVLALGARITGDELAFCIVKTWLLTEFAGGRHQTRIEKISSLEK